MGLPVCLTGPLPKAPARLYGALARSVQKRARLAPRALRANRRVCAGAGHADPRPFARRRGCGARNVRRRLAPASAVRRAPQLAQRLYLEYRAQPRARSRSRERPPCALRARVRAGNPELLRGRRPALHARVRHEGTGIGLALVQELARLHGASVQATSVPGKGTTLFVRIKRGSAHLPAERIDARPARRPASSSERLWE